jgi:hypothetical protein
LPRGEPAPPSEGTSDGTLSPVSHINSIVPAHIWTYLIPLLVFAGWLWVVRHFRGTFLDGVAGRALIVGVAGWLFWWTILSHALPLPISGPPFSMPPLHEAPLPPLPSPLTLLGHLFLLLVYLVGALFEVLFELGNTLDHSDAGKILPILFLVWLVWVVVDDMGNRLDNLKRRVDRLDELEQTRNP